MRLGVRTLFSLTVLVPLAAVGLAVIWAGGRAVESAVQARLEEDVQLVARAIQLPLSRALAEGREEQLYEALESAFRIRRLYGAAVYGSGGELLAQVGAQGADSVATPPMERVAESGRGGEYGQLGERRVYSYFVPLTTPGGRVTGLLQVTRRRSDIEAAVRRVRLQVAGVFTGVWVAMAALVLLTYQRGVARHFERLAAAMRGVERGARDARIAEKGPREVADIARAFNRMVEGVERAEAEVADRRRRESALEARLRTSAKLAAIGRLAGGLAHELGTPLAVVDGMAQRLQRRGEADAEASAIRGAVERMGRIVRELLAFGAYDSGQRERVPAARLLTGAAGAVRGQAEALAVDMEVADPDPELELRCDAVRVEAALVHLLRNAVQAAGRNGVVRAAAEKRGEAMAFMVEDDGEGVAEDLRDRLFDPFFTTKPPGEGSGLGLAVVHAVAEEHAGTVEVDASTLGGARFTLRLGSEVGDG